MTWNFAMQAIDQIINSAAKQLYMSGGQVTRPSSSAAPTAPRPALAPSTARTIRPGTATCRASTSSPPSAPPTPRACSRPPSARTTPIVFLENEILYGSTGLVPKVDDYVLPIGKARIARPGKDVTLVSFSMGMRYATQATEKLVAAGVDVELIDLRTLRPMDSATVIECVKKTGRLVTVEEGWPQGGIGAELARVVRAKRFDYLDAPADARHRQGRADALRRQPRKAGVAQRR